MEKRGDMDSPFKFDRSQQMFWTLPGVSHFSKQVYPEWPMNLKETCARSRPLPSSRKKGLGRLKPHLNA